MGDDTEIFVGIDVAKVRNAMAIADGERGGEVRFLGEVDSSEESMRRVVKRSQPSTVAFNFAMKPVQPATGCYRLITSTWPPARSLVAPPPGSPGRPGDQVKTNRRDAISLAKRFACR